MIIGLCGYIGCGKDTCASFLEEYHHFQRFSFASSIKDIVASLFGWDRKDLEGSTQQAREWREKVDPWWTEQLERVVTPRLMLQMVGTEMFRDCLSPYFWTTVLKRRIQQSEAEHIVLTDCRFPVEGDLIRLLGGIIVKIERQPELQNDLSYSHSSERYISSITPDATIDNTKDLDHLRLQVDTLIHFCQTK